MKSPAKNMNFILVIILIAVVAIVLSSFFNKSDTLEGRDIVIGVIAPLTGSHSEGGLSMKKGIETAIININDAGGINGHKVDLRIYNDENNPDLSQDAADLLIHKDNVDAIIGSFSSECTLAIVDIVNDNHVPLIVPVGMSDEIMRGNDYVFRNTLGASTAWRKINSFVNSSKNEYVLLDGLGARTIGILWQNDSWGDEMQSIVVSDIEALGKSESIIFNESFALGQTDFSDIFSRYRHNFPDIIYAISAGNESNDIVCTGREQGFNGLFFGEGGFNYTSFDENLEEYTEGCLFTTQWHPSFSTPMSDVFLKCYTQSYNETPDMFAAISYEAVYILAESVGNLGNRIVNPNFRELLRDELSKTRSVNGITGIITFDSTGQCDRPMFLLQKIWDGRSVQSLIVYPSKYTQSQLKWNFETKN